jgi:hypothetical protein
MTEAESNKSASTSSSTPRDGTTEGDRNPSLAEIEYKSLNSYFERILKLTFLAIGVVVAVAGAMLWKSSSEAKSSIEATRIEAAHEIENVGKQSSEIARIEAGKRIDEAFEKGNVQQMIEHIARERVDAAVEREINQTLDVRIKNLKAEIAEMGDVASASARLRLGFREGLDALTKQSTSSDESVRNYARRSLLMIGSDYETNLKKQFPEISTLKLEALLFSPGKAPTGLKSILLAIQHSDNVNAVTASFMVMRETTGANIPVFDIPAAEKWCADNEPKCE